MVTQKVKVSHSLVAVGPVGFRRAHHMKGRAHLSPFPDLSFPDSKEVPIYCYVDGVFQALDGEAWV